MRKLLVIFALGLVLVAAYLFLDPGEVRCKPVIAIWPGFSSVGLDPDLEYISQGVALDLEYQLISHADLVVATMDHWFDVESAHDYAVLLGADFLVDGSVQLVDSQIQITVQLIDMQLEEQLWERSYKVPFAAYFDESHDSATLRIVEYISSELPESVRRSSGKSCGVG